MTRYLLCERCKHKMQLHDDDAAQGWKQRRVALLSKKPADHAITVITEERTFTNPVPFLLCDGCDEAISDGSKIVAVTMWLDNEAVPDWETHYGTLI